LAVVGLHGNVFKPHTGTKTSVLFVQKWDDKLCPKKEDYPIFFATMQEPSKDNSGDKIYLRKKDFEQFQIQPETPVPEQQELDMAEEQRAFYVKTAKDLDEFVLDEHDHLVVNHDLFSQSLKYGLKTREGIAEAFAEFAKKEGLSFFV
jgi:type I restriction enzyme M protein